jgi:hypothetical protein
LLVFTHVIVMLCSGFGKYDFGNLYDRLKATEGAGWCATVCWLLLAVLLFVRFRNRRRGAQSKEVSEDKDNLVPPTGEGKFGAGFENDPEAYTPVA